MASDIPFAVPGLMEFQTPLSDELMPVMVLPRHIVSDTKWAGIAALGPVTHGGSNMPHAATRSVLEFVSKDGWCPVEEFASNDGRYVPELTLDSADGLVTISNPATWTFAVPEQPLTLAVGLWDWNVKVTDASGESAVYFTGTLLIAAF